MTKKIIIAYGAPGKPLVRLPDRRYKVLAQRVYHPITKRSLNRIILRMKRAGAFLPIFDVEYHRRNIVDDVVRCATGFFPSELHPGFPDEVIAGENMRSPRIDRKWIGIRPMTFIVKERQRHALFNER